MVSDNDLPARLADAAREAVPLGRRNTAAPRFAPRSRRGGSRLYDRENLFAELALIRDRIDVVVACGREEFYDGAQAYDVACRSMDDGFFWLAITQRIPMILDRIKTDD